MEKKPIEVLINGLKDLYLQAAQARQERQLPEPALQEQKPA